jgi:hypothetical protein
VGLFSLNDSGLKELACRCVPCSDGTDLKSQKRMNDARFGNRHLKGAIPLSCTREIRSALAMGD